MPCKELPSGWRLSRYWQSSYLCQEETGKQDNMTTCFLEALVPVLPNHFDLLSHYIAPAMQHARTAWLLKNAQVCKHHANPQNHKILRGNLFCKIFVANHYKSTSGSLPLLCWWQFDNLVSVVKQKHFPLFCQGLPGTQGLEGRLFREPLDNAAIIKCFT